MQQEGCALKRLQCTYTYLLEIERTETTKLEFVLMRTTRHRLFRRRAGVVTPRAHGTLLPSRRLNDWARSYASRTDSDEHRKQSPTQRQRKEIAYVRKWRVLEPQHLKRSVLLKSRKLGLTAPPHCLLSAEIREERQRPA